MKHVYEIDKTQKVVRETWHGPLTKKDLVAAIFGVLEDPAWQKHMNVVSDFRDAQLELTTHEMNEFTKWIRIQDNAKKLAIVVNRSMDPGMMRLFEMLTEPALDSNFMIFYELEDAENWFKTETKNL